MDRNEAIKLVRRMPCTIDEQEALRTLIPELRESEEENLKNKSGYYKAGKFWKASTLWNAVKDKSSQRVPNRYILQECTWNIGTLQRFANEVKNVQEVSLDYPIILDMNGNILDGAHRVVKAYLEGKDIDIVYLEDDEWPEPDYDEEKAVKESEDENIRRSLVDYFRQFNPEDKWDEEITFGDVLAYLEKQKENPWSEEDEAIVKTMCKEGDLKPSEIAWLMNLKNRMCKESLHISETCKENTNSFTGISEDKKIIRVIGLALTDIPEERFASLGTTLKDCLSYLEKQKEPVHIPDKFSGLKSLMLQYLQSAANRKDDAEIEDDTDLYGRKILDYVWKQDEKQKEHTWSPSEDEMGVLYKLCYISNQISDEDDTNLTRLYQDLKREYFNGHSFENMFPKEKQEEQKPTAEERIENDKHFLSVCQHLETLISESKNDEAKEIDKDYRWLCEFYRKVSFCIYKKPAEWSTE